MSPDLQIVQESNSLEEMESPEATKGHKLFEDFEEGLLKPMKISAFCPQTSKKAKKLISESSDILGHGKENFSGHSNTPIEEEASVSKKLTKYRSHTDFKLPNFTTLTTVKSVSKGRKALT